MPSASPAGAGASRQRGAVRGAWRLVYQAAGASAMSRATFTSRHQNRDSKSACLRLGEPLTRCSLDAFVHFLFFTFLMQGQFVFGHGDLQLGFRLPTFEAHLDFQGLVIKELVRAVDAVVLGS